MLTAVLAEDVEVLVDDDPDEDEEDVDESERTGLGGTKAMWLA